MRGIKLRAFHKPTKKVFNVVQIDFLNGFVFSYEKILGMSKHSYFDTVSYELKDCELLQYTGLKDDDGKEIFEGDIVKITFKEYYSNEQFTIDPDETGTKIIGKVIFDIFSYRIEFDDKTSIFLFEVDSNDIDIKVVGNIYENKELLEVVI